MYVRIVVDLDDEEIEVDVHDAAEDDVILLNANDGTVNVDGLAVTDPYDGERFGVMVLIGVLTSSSVYSSTSTSDSLLSAV